MSDILSKKLHAVWTWSAAAFLTIVFAGCGALDGGSAQQPGVTGPAGSSKRPVNVLQVGDLVKVDFSGPANPPQAHEEHIKQDGTIELYLINKVQAAGKTPGELQNEIRDLYVPTYYRNLNVTVRAADQLYYVGGQVNAGGRQPYLGPVTVLGAIKAAGDFTDFANRKKVQVIRADGTSLKVDCTKALKNPELDVPVYPGDRIDVPQRLF